MNQIKHGTFKYEEYFPNSIFIKDIKNSPLIKSGQSVYCSEILKKLLYEYECIEKNGEMSISTLVGYRKIINNPLIPYFGRYRIDKIDTMVIRSFIESMDVTAKRIRNCLTILRAMFALAQEMQLVKVNPINDLDIRRLLRTYGNKSEYDPIPFTEKEKNILLESLTGQFKNLVQFGLWAGLRSSEVIALRWQDVDFKDGIVNISQAKVENKIKGTKTKSGTRKIILLPKARDALMQQIQFTQLNSEFIFHNPNTDKPWSSSSKLGQYWRNELKNINIKYRNIYQLRHTYASTLLSNGENIWFVATQMGHVDTEMLIKRYGKWIPQENSGGYEFKGKY